VTEEAIEELCNALDLEFKKAEFTNEMSQVKLDFREVVSKNLLSDSRRHFIKKLERELSGLNPSDSGGAFHPTLLDGSKFDVKIQGAYSLNGIPIKGECPTDLNFWVMLTKTPFMPGNPLMKSDVGTIVLDNWTLLKVYDVLSLPSGWILHKVAVSAFL
jgi:alanyl-tRNA synthetase